MHVVIIGAGPAGLTCAYQLLKADGDISVTILESSNAIGGISRTVNTGGERMDMGGHRFFSKDKRVMDMWTEIMPMQGAPARDDIITGRSVPLAPGGPDPETQDEVMLTRRRVSRIYYAGRLFDYPVRLNASALNAMGARTAARAGLSYIGACVRKRRENSLEDFYINNFGKVLYEMFFKGYTQKLWGRKPSDISAEWGAQRTRGLSIRGVLADMLAKPLGLAHTRQTSLIDSFLYPKYGPGQLWEAVAAKISALGGDIKLNARVERVETEGARVKHIWARQGGAQFKYQLDACFSSMSVKDLICAIDGAPEAVANVARELPYRDFITVGLLLNKLNLKNETKHATAGDIVPDCWIYVQDASVKVGRIQIFNNWSPYLLRDPEHTIWIGLEYFCAEGDEFWNMPDDARVRLALDELSSMGIIDARVMPLKSHIERVPKAYPAYFGAYNDFGVVRQYLDAFENLYCIGRNGQHRYNNMDHSMLTAMNAARIYLSGARDKRDIWDVNTEKTYHEIK